MPSFKFRIIDDDPTECVVSVNGNVVRTITEGLTNPSITVNLTDNLFVIGSNTITIKVTDATKNITEEILTVLKQNITVKEGNSLLIDNEKYKILSKVDNPSSITVNIDKELTRDIVPGETCKLLRDSIKVELISGDDESVVEPRLVSIEPTGRNTVLETYEVVKQCRIVRPKLTINGNIDTCVKRPSILANFLSE